MQNDYPVIDFNQYGGTGDEDRLLLFAATAKDIAQWAGIPRKGWRIRMLFQRWITQGRDSELKEFWKRASREDGGTEYVLGPSAIVIAMDGEPNIRDGRIILSRTDYIAGCISNEEKLCKLSEVVLPSILKRLDANDMELIEKFSESPFNREFPKIGHNYVLEFAAQLVQMKNSAADFIKVHSIPEDEVVGLITALEALSRPAIVVDGQHRLYGAQGVKRNVMLPVVAMTKADWLHQIYQFIVINEKAQKVDSDLLNDIFASSLTPTEQGKMRSKFIRVKVDIEQRIAGVLAGRSENSPFHQMISLNLPNPPIEERNAYISQTIIQNLIDGGRGTLGWRSNDMFYENYVKPTYPNRDDWEGWRDGKWREYWFAFWNTVRKHYTPLAKKQLANNEFEIWSKSVQSNLTKGVGLKLFQRFFMETMINEIKAEQGVYNVLVNHLGPEKARVETEAAVQKKAIPANVDDFVKVVEEGFLSRFPVRFFTSRWENSLDDQSGQEALLYQMNEAYTRDNWRARGGGVFVNGSE